MVVSKRGIFNNDGTDFVSGVGRKSNDLAAPVLEFDVFSRYLAGTVFV